MYVYNKIPTGIETPRKACEESDSVRDFFSVLFAYPVRSPEFNFICFIPVG